jgi:hypothetical protein
MRVIFPVVWPSRIAWCAAAASASGKVCETSTRSLPSWASLASSGRGHHPGSLGAEPDRQPAGIGAERPAVGLDVHRVDADRPDLDPGLARTGVPDGFLDDRKNFGSAVLGGDHNKRHIARNIPSAAAHSRLPAFGPTRALAFQYNGTKWTVIRTPNPATGSNSDGFGADSAIPGTTQFWAVGGEGADTLAAYIS